MTVSSVARCARRRPGARTRSWPCAAAPVRGARRRRVGEHKGLRAHHLREQIVEVVVVYSRHRRVANPQVGALQLHSRPSAAAQSRRRGTGTARQIARAVGVEGGGDRRATRLQQVDEAAERHVDAPAATASTSSRTTPGSLSVCGPQRGGLQPLSQYACAPVAPRRHATVTPNLRNDRRGGRRLAAAAAHDERSILLDVLRKEGRGRWFAGELADGGRGGRRRRFGGVGFHAAALKPSPTRAPGAAARGRGRGR